MQTIIKPQKSLALNWKEIWIYRELAGVLAWRDVKVRYKQTIVGIAWAILQPLLLTIVFTFIFGNVAGISSGGIPYPIFTFIGLLFWNFFSSTLSGASNSLVVNEQIIKKIYFPKILLPFSSVAVSLIDFLFASVIFVGISIYYQIIPGIMGLVLLIPALFIAFLSAAGLGLFLSAVNVKYRDVRYALPFFIQLLLFVTPVIYPISSLSVKFQWILALNPMTGVIESIRAGFFHAGPIPWNLLGVSMALAVLFFVVGLLYFRKTEKYFADLV